jgi:hypothetical protein
MDNLNHFVHVIIIRLPKLKNHGYKKCDNDSAKSDHLVVRLI